MPDSTEKPGSYKPPGITETDGRTTDTSRQVSVVVRPEELDHFKRTPEGKEYAGDHLYVDLYGCQGDLTDKKMIEKMFADCTEAAGATLLFVHTHVFTPSGGISGVAVLAESHISIHTWPERGFAAMDLFMCGDAFPGKALPEIEEALQPTHVEAENRQRGDKLSEHPA